jgi:hypothetical protein
MGHQPPVLAKIENDAGPAIWSSKHRPDEKAERFFLQESRFFDRQINEMK